MLNEESVKNWIGNILIIVGLIIFCLMIITINQGIWKYLAGAIAIITVMKGVKMLTRI